MSNTTTTTTKPLHVIQPGRAGDEEMIHFATSYGFECDPSLVHYWFTARKAYAWLRGNGFTVEHKDSISLADLDEIFTYKA